MAGMVCACSARPERVDPQEYPGANLDTDVVPIPTNCDTLTHTFGMTMDGYVADTLGGYGVYEYEAIPDRLTTIYLTACGPEETSQYLTLAFYGIDRVEPGEHPVNRFAFEDGGFVFAYTDTTGVSTVNCNELPKGTVTITESSFASVAGSFELEAQCADETNLDRRPGVTTFSGSFAARNVGRE
jgi:hypothetical protein